MQKSNWSIMYFISVGMSMGRPRKNRDNLVGRAGRQAIEQEDLQRESQKWMRRKVTLARFAQ
jgi:hypothetical protein